MKIGPFSISISFSFSISLSFIFTLFQSVLFPVFENNRFFCRAIRTHSNIVTRWSSGCHWRNEWLHSERGFEFNWIIWYSK
jgi:hypothetical protein